MYNIAPNTEIREIQLEGILLNIVEIQILQTLYLVEFFASDTNTYQILIPKLYVQTIKGWIEENKYNIQTLIVKKYTTNNQSRYKWVGVK